MRIARMRHRIKWIEEGTWACCVCLCILHRHEHAKRRRKRWRERESDERKKGKKSKTKWDWMAQARELTRQKKKQTKRSNQKIKTFCFEIFSSHQSVLYATMTATATTTNRRSDHIQSAWFGFVFVATISLQFFLCLFASSSLFLFPSFSCVFSFSSSCDAQIAKLVENKVWCFSFLFSFCITQAPICQFHSHIRLRSLILFFSSFFRHLFLHTSHFLNHHRTQIAIATRKISRKSDRARVQRKRCRRVWGVTYIIEIVGCRRRMWMGMQLQ